MHFRMMLLLHVARGGGGLLWNCCSRSGLSFLASSRINSSSRQQAGQVVSTSSFTTMRSSSTSDESSSSSSKYYTIGITGSSGLVGTALRDELRRRVTVNGKPIRIVQLIRGSRAEQLASKSKKLRTDDDADFGDATTTTLMWNPFGTKPEEVVDPSALARMDAVVHLAGENVATGLGRLGFLGIRPWTEEKKTQLLESRVIPTKALSKAIASSPSKPKNPQTFLVASGIGAYGANFVGDALEAVDESMDVSNTGGFLAHLSREWEAATSEAENANACCRLVNMRFGVVLSTKGGALGKLYPIFWAGGGGIVGSGRQYFSFISARDSARAIIHALETPSLEGPVNFSSPQPCTNYDFTKALGGVLNRPTLLPLPAFMVSLAFGEMGEEMLLGGVRAVPGKLLQSGFEFQHPTITQALQSAVGETI